MRGIKKVSTLGMNRDEWLELRRHTIGGSDAAGIIGLSKWSSPMSVWADKTGRIPYKSATEAMRLGRDLEGYVARRWMEINGKKVRRLNALLYNERYSFAHADIDRKIIGEQAGLECKTTSTLDVKQFQGVEFPEQYYAQCVHYLAVTGYDRWYLSVLVFGRGLFNFVLERDQAEIDALMTAEDEFWKLVMKDTPPSVDGSEPTTDTLQTIYRESSDTEIVQLFGREGLLQEWSGIKEQMEALKDRKEEIENTIKQDLREAERGACTGYGISWRPQTRRTFQTAAFEKAHPNIDLSPFYRTSESRVLRITIDKEAIDHGK